MASPITERHDIVQGPSKFDLMISLCAAEVVIANG